LHSGFYVLALAALGFWTVLRGNDGPGRAAIYASSLASIPLVVIGVLGAWLWGSIGGRLGRHFIGLRRLTA
jgi:hypothetical protein